MKKPNPNNRIAYIIGHRWDDGTIGDYTIHNQTVFNGDIEEAKNVLEYVKKQDPDRAHLYQIFKLV